MAPPEAMRRVFVAQWLRKAAQDVEAAEVLLRAERPLLVASCFHAQQAAEKHLKAFLVWHQVDFPKTHALGELLDLVGQVDATLADRLADAVVLSPYGVEVRYPSEAPDPDRHEAEAALELTCKVRDVVLHALPSM